MITILGLRNHGDEYAQTRHNVGAMVLEDFMQTHAFPRVVASARYVSDVSEGVVDGVSVRALLPTTYMNNSGVAAKKSTAVPAEIIVLHDEVDLALGTFKISFGRGPGGNNGVDSIVRELGTKDFIRIRIGISPRTLLGTLKRPQGAQMAKYVLGDFTKNERSKIADVSPKIQEALVVLIMKGKEAAMNAYNG